MLGDPSPAWAPKASERQSPERKPDCTEPRRPCIGILYALAQDPNKATTASPGPALSPTLGSVSEASSSSPERTDFLFFVPCEGPCSDRTWLDTNHRRRKWTGWLHFRPRLPETRTGAFAVHRGAQKGQWRAAPRLQQHPHWLGARGLPHVRAESVL